MLYQPDESVDMDINPLYGPGPTSLTTRKINWYVPFGRRSATVNL